MKVVIYTQNNCQFTPQEKTYLTSKGLTFEERNVETNKTFLDEMMKLGANFAGTPVTQIMKDDGTTAVLKGFTQAEFDAALGGTASVVAANSDMNVPTAPAAPAEPVQTPPAPMPDPVPAPMPEPVPTPEPTPAPVEPPVQSANADMNLPSSGQAMPTDQPAVPPMPPMDSPSSPQVPEPVVPPAPEPVPMPEPTPAPVEPPVQSANADMTMPAAQADQPVVPPMPPMPEPASAPEPMPMPEPTPAPVAPVVETPVAPTQTASNPLDAILADLQQKVAAATPATQTASADMTMPSATPPAPAPVTPVEPVQTPTPAPVAPATSDVVPQAPAAPMADMPTPPAPSADLPSVPDFK